MEAVGFIGTGIMGKPMAENLIKAEKMRLAIVGPVDEDEPLDELLKL